MNAPLPLLDVKDLVVRFRAAGFALPFTGARYINAVNGVNLAVAPGETLGIVGESGCGKSTLGRAILQLVEAQAGEVRFEDGVISDRDKGSIARLRGQAAMIFQDPYGSLNPRIPVGEAIAEVLRVHGKTAPDAVPARVAELLRLVGLSAELADRRPHQLSGGQCQRVGIARALAIEPRLIIADECVAALDVSIQAQILNLLMELQRRMNLSLIFISHDLGVVRHLCRRVAVMYLGRIVEIGPTEQVFAAPKHPYTRALLAAVPDIDPDRALAPPQLRGEPPSPQDLPAGCPFHPRCPHAQEVCAHGDAPVLRPSERGQVACHFDLPPNAQQGEEP
ncbi:MAG TPA: ABC transporter ATP-binding protein [Dongiaceae bacterium]|nr:ABC transporter ATP-binding protein [Dongiaceae bacterium]